MMHLVLLKYMHEHHPQRVASASGVLLSTGCRILLFRPARANLARDYPRNSVQARTLRPAGRMLAADEAEVVAPAACGHASYVLQCMDSLAWLDSLLHDAATCLTSGPQPSNASTSTSLVRHGSNHTLVRPV